MNGNITFDGVADCNTLSTPIFNPVVNQDLTFKIFDLNGRLLLIGKTHPNMYESLEFGVYAVIVDGYDPFKIIKQN